jgi:aryl-alcohol dehydrogenase-like predicted oxidoreductase
MNPLLNLKKSLGFGFMNASWGGAPTLIPGDAREQFKRALHTAMDAGVRLFDTADIYAPSFEEFGHNEVLLREAIEGWNAPQSDKDELIIATKGGITRAAGEVWSKDASYEYLMTAVEASAKRLGLAKIPVWQHHRLDFHLTLSEQIKNLRKLRENAPIRHIGVSNYSAEQLRRALDVIGGPNDGGIVSVQNQLNSVYRHDIDVLEVCEEHGLAFLPWSPSKGVTSKYVGSETFDRFNQIAESRGVSRFAVAQAWLRSLSPNLVPIPGVTKIESILDAIGAIELRLTASELAALSDLPESQPVDDELLNHQPIAE